MGLLFFDNIHKTFIFRCTFHERDIPKKAGFIWDDAKKHWHQPNFAKAWKLKQYAVDSAASKYKEMAGFFDLPKDFKLKYLKPIRNGKVVDLDDDQKEAINFILTRKNSFNAGDRGVGKSAVAAVAVDNYRRWISKNRKKTCLIICMPSLVFNWQEEIKDWTGQSCRLVLTKKDPILLDQPFLIVPDSLLIDERIYSDILMAGRNGHFDFIVEDEIHRMKNLKAGRSLCFYGGEKKEKGKTVRKYFPIYKHAERVTVASGTPMPNKPVELWPVLHHLAPHTIDGMTFFEFVSKYCAAFKTEWGWDFSGSSNIIELHERVFGTFMIRHEKKNVPKKHRQFITLKPCKRTMNRLKKFSDLKDEEIIAGLEGKDFSMMAEISALRKTVGIEIAKESLEYVENIVDGGDKVLLFAWHREVIEQLQTDLSDKFGAECVDVIYGGVSRTKKHEINKRFQTDKGLKILIMQVLTAVGVTLTASRRAIFIERSPVPGDNDQAEDRVHRKGQTEDCVIDILRFPHDVSYRIEQILKPKQKVINEFLTKGE